MRQKKKKKKVKYKDNEITDNIFRTILSTGIKDGQETLDIAKH